MASPGTINLDAKFDDELNENHKRPAPQFNGTSSLRRDNGGETAKQQNNNRQRTNKQRTAKIR